MNPFGKTIENLTELDIVTFCQQKHPESSWLDYKEAFSNKDNEQIAKIVSALANAHGGLVLIGVADDKQQGKAGKPIKWDGIDTSDKGEQRVKQICLDALTPPVVPLVRAIPLSSGKEIIVAIVHESESAPHEILATNDVYIRTNDISHLAKDGKKASVSDITWLQNRRIKAIEQRERLLQRAKQRGFRPDGLDSPYNEIYCIPLYPHEPISDFSELVQSGRENSFMPPLVEMEDPKLRTANESVFARAYHKGTSASLYYEANIYGLVYFYLQVGIGKTSIPIADFCRYLFPLILAASSLYLKTNYAGLVQLGMGADFAKGCEIDTGFGDKVDKILDESFLIKQTILAQDLRAEDVTVEILKQFLWAGGVGVELANSQGIDKLLRDNHKHFFRSG